jgi:hypothetical protein
MRQRLIYIIAQIKEELPFIIKSLMFLIKKDRPQNKRITAKFTN